MTVGELIKELEKYPKDRRVLLYSHGRCGVAEQDEIFIYTFEDGTVLKLLDVGLSVAEVWKLKELHGKCRAVESEE